MRSSARASTCGQRCVSVQSQAPAEEEDEGEEEETEELGQTETYAEYIPSKCECLAITRVWESLFSIEGQPNSLLPYFSASSIWWWVWHIPGL